MDIVINLATLAGVTAALTEMAKRVFNLQDRFVAGTSLVLGIGLSLIFIGLTKQGAIDGIVAALMASGLWSHVTTWAGQ